MNENDPQFNTGLILEKHLSPTMFVSGFSPLQWKKRLTVKDGYISWKDFLPAEELQNNFGVDKMNCTAMGTDNLIETDLKEKTGVEINLSDRHVSVIAGNTKWGNFVYKPIEAIMALGFVLETEYPEFYEKQPPTWEEYHKPLPDNIPPKAKGRLDEYDFDREFILPPSHDEMFEKLQEAPIGVTVRYASSPNAEDILNPSGTQNHWVMVYGAKYGEYWEVFDHYEWQRGKGVKKRYAWNYPFEVAMRVHIDLKNNNNNYMFKQNYPYLLVEGNEQKLGFFLDGRMVVAQGLIEWAVIRENVNSRLKRFEPAIPVKLKDWNSVPHVNLKGEPLPK